MPHYLIQTAYTTEAWGAQVANPQSAVDRVRPAVEGLGGRIEEAYYTFGDYDVVAVLEFPDDSAAAAFSLAAQAGGAVRAFRTIPLITIDQGMKAMSKAGNARYNAPMSLESPLIDEELGFDES